MAKSSGSEKYAYLNRLSTEQLEELLRADIESPESGDVDVIFHILEVIEKREEEHPTGRLPDEDRAWAEFQQYYNIPEGEGRSLYPTAEESRPECEISKPHSGDVVHLYPKLKLLGIVAAVVVGIFGMMITAQAAGIDVFGAIGRWTDETFHFVSSSTGAIQDSADATPGSEDTNGYQLLQAALEECGITEDLAPTWYPAEFEASDPKILSGKLSDAVHVSFSDGDEGFFNINIARYKSASNLATGTFEKDSASVEQYTSGAKTFYIMSNIDTITATWSEGLLVERISGNLQINEIKAVIDSIGG